MKTLRQPLAVALLLAAVGPLGAQIAAPVKPVQELEEKEVVQLSPFEVTADSESGYQATQTLAGTRIRTDLKDVGAAITVVTKELLRDLGATDAGTLLQYTPNAEVSGTYGTYAGLGNGTGVDESGSLRAPGGNNNRVRGLDTADTARDFFVTDIPWDAYNIDRLEIQRGPNSILFGLGSPAGMVNAAMRSAEFRNLGNVETRVGSYGSTRVAVDLNQQLLPDVLALRFDGLRDYQKYDQTQAWEHDRRYSGALRFDPRLFKNRSFHTTFKARYENGDITANRPRTVTPNDNFSAWYRPTAITADNPFGGMGKLAVNNPYDPWRTDNIVAGDGRGLIQRGTTNYQPWLSNQTNAQQPYWTIDGTTNQLYRVMGGWINAGARNATGGLSGAAVGLLGKRTNDNFYGVNSLPGAAIGLGLPNASFGQYRNTSLLDASVFDFYNNLIDGPNKREFENWDAYNFDLTQTGWDDRVGLQLTYDRQKYERGGSAFLGGAPTLSIDILKNFPDYYLTSANPAGTTNPNFGRPFVTSQSGGSGSSYESDREYYRASLFTEFRATDVFARESFLAKLIGKHRFNGVYSTERLAVETRGWVENANSQDWAAFWNGTNGSGSSIVDRPPQAFVYLGSSVANLTSAAGAQLPALNQTITMVDPNITVFNPTWVNFSVPFGDPWNVPSSLFPVFNGVPNPESTAQLTQASNPANYVGWTTFNTNLLRYNNGADLSLLTRAQKSRRATTSYAGSWQSYLWNDALVTTLGWRYDVVKGKAVNALPVGSNRNILNVQPDVYRLPDEYPANQIFKDHSTSGGAVLHLNKLFGEERDPLPLNVSLSYNRSNNFQVTDTRRDIYGQPIGNPTGRTKDYGVLLSTKDGRYTLRALRYQTNVKGANSGISDPAGIGRVIAQGLRFRNVFLYDLGVYDWATRNQPQGRNTWGGPAPSANSALTAAEGRALEDSAIRTWNDIQAFLTDKGFFDAWGFKPQDLSVLTDRTTYEANPEQFLPPDTSRVFGYVATPPPGFTVTADTASKGYEFEFTANPTRNWRIAFNASKTTAVRRNVGGEVLDEYIAFLDEKLTNTPAGNMPQFGNTGLSIFANVFGPWRANYVLMKLQEDAAAPEIRPWRYNLVTNYTFHQGFLKNVGVGGSYRWQDKVIIGYPVVDGGTFDLTQPYRGPSENAIDLWASYERKLSDKLRWRIQLNVRNAFDNRGLVPISIEPDGNTFASVRTRPIQEWFLTNTFSF